MGIGLKGKLVTLDAMVLFALVPRLNKCKLA